MHPQCRSRASRAFLRRAPSQARIHAASSSLATSLSGTHYMCQERPPASYQYINLRRQRRPSTSPPPLSTKSRAHASPTSTPSPSCTSASQQIPHTRITSPTQTRASLRVVLLHQRLVLPQRTPGLHPVTGLGPAAPHSRLPSLHLAPITSLHLGNGLAA